MIRRRRYIPRESAKHRAERSVRARTVSTVRARDGACRARGLGDCAGPLDPHEVISRARWRLGYLDPENCVLLCRAHHDWVHAHPEEATSLGLLDRFRKSV